MRKRLISLVLVLSMLFSLLPTAVLAAEAEGDSAAAASANPFIDVKEGDWYYTAVQYVRINNIFNGTTPATFDPNGTMTRGMFVTVLGRMAGVDAAAYKGMSSFSDVPVDAYYAPYVAWAYKHGITEGTGEGKFSPNALINRQQLATFFMRYFELFGVNYDTGSSVTTAPADLDRVADWAEAAVLKFWSLGLLNGDGVNFDPTGNATRAQTATLCMRMDNAVETWYKEPGVPSDRVRIEVDGNQSDEEDESDISVPVYAVRFMDGNRPIDTLYAPLGTALGRVPDVEDSSKEGYILLGYYTDPEFTTPFYAENPVNQNLTVYAKYHKMESTEALSCTSFAQMDQSPDLSFSIQRVSGAISKDNAATLEVKDGSDPVELSVTGSTSGTCTVSAVGGFNEGCCYELTLAEGWVFVDMPETVRTASFSIAKEAVESLKMSDDIIYVKDDADAFTYTISGIDYEVLTSDLVTAAGGSFVYTGSAPLGVDDILCIYTGTKPTERAASDGVVTEAEDGSTSGSDLLDPAVYVRVQSVSGTTVTFAPLTEEDQEKLYEVPDNFPILVPSYPTESTGTVSIYSLDVLMYETMLGKTDGTLANALAKVNVGDFITLYVNDADGIAAESDLCFARITGYNPADGTITYQLTTKQAILESMDLYSGVTLDGNDLVTEEQRLALQAALLAQVEESNLAEEAAFMVAELVTQTDGFTENLSVQELLLTDENGEPLSDEEIELLDFSSGFELMDDIRLSVKLITDGNQLHFGDGVQLSISVDAKVAVHTVSNNTVAIDLSASFVQEVTVQPVLKGSLVYKEILFIPVPIGVHVGASVDVMSYTALDFAAEIYTFSSDSQSVWEEVQSIVDSNISVVGMRDIPEALADELYTVGDVMDKITELQNAIDQSAGTAAELRTYQTYLTSLWRVVERAGITTQRKWTQMNTTLNRTSVSSDLLEIMETANRSGISQRYQQSMDALLQKYSEMLTTETDWITLVEEAIFAKEVYVYALVIGVEVDFLVHTDMSIAIGSSLRYEVGKRYSFWFEIGLFTPTAGSSTMDIIDEQFAFRFYVMGKLGVRAGVKAKLYAGIGSGKLASVGIAAEMGPYIKLYGFFVYERTDYRKANSQHKVSSELMTGALMLEFGLYFILSFEAEALGGLFEYSYDFLNEEIPLLTAGENRYYYDFDYEPQRDEMIVIRDEDGDPLNGVAMTLPDSVRALSFLDLPSGFLGSESRSYNKYSITLSNPNFTLTVLPDGETAEISVTVPDNTRYMECDLTITYLHSKLAFSNYDISVTVPLVWTTLTDLELTEYYTASVCVGNDAVGYETVWTKRVLKEQPFDLPTDGEIRELMGWNDAKYKTGTGYGSQDTTDVTLVADKTYYYNVGVQEYSVTVTGIERADGSTYSKTYTARYGESFDFSGLVGTGTDIPGVEYTKFANVTTTATITASGQTRVMDLTQPINGSMAEVLARGVTAKANYVDDSVTAYFTFTGIPQGEISMTLRKGSQVGYGEYSRLVDIVAQEEDMTILDISPAFAPLTSATNYVVTCGTYTGKRAAILFHANFGTEEGANENGYYTVESTLLEKLTMIRLEGGYIGPLPTFTRIGYEKIGDGESAWHLPAVIADEPAQEEIPDEEITDEEITDDETSDGEAAEDEITELEPVNPWNTPLGEEFTTEKMPEGGVDVYAHWDPLEFEISFHSNGGSSVPSRVVSYDNTFGSVYSEDISGNAVYTPTTLPVPEKAGYRFVGWFTTPNGPKDAGSVQVTEDTVVKILKDTTLYAYWRELVEIPDSVVNTGEMEQYTYKRYTPHYANYTFVGGTYSFADGLDINETERKTCQYPTTGYKVEYLPYSDNSRYVDDPINADYYYIHVTREADGYYDYFEAMYGSASDMPLYIEKAVRTEAFPDFSTTAIPLSVNYQGYAGLELSPSYSAYNTFDISSETTITYLTNSSMTASEPGYLYGLVPGTTYSVRVKITGDPNYYDSTSSVGYEVSTAAAPTGSWSNYATSLPSPDSSGNYVITTAGQLAALAVAVNGGETFAGKTFTLGADIDLRGHNWVPIGGYSDLGMPPLADSIYSACGSDYAHFNGTLDGNDHVIYGLYSSHEGKQCVGLFGNLGEDSAVKNLVVDDAYLYGLRYVGTIAGSVNIGSTINKCVSYATVQGTNQVGGIVGYFCGYENPEDNVMDRGVAVNCINYGPVSGTTNVGGITGKTYEAHVCNCANFGTISGTNNVGGITGSNGSHDHLVIISYTYNNVNYGKVAGTGEYIGAIIGRNVYDHGYVQYNYYLAGTASCNGSNRNAVGTADGSLADNAVNGELDRQYLNASFTYGNYALSQKYIGDTAYLISAVKAWSEAYGGTYAAQSWGYDGPNGEPIPLNVPKRKTLR